LDDPCDPDSEADQAVGTDGCHITPAGRA
jgi:hypothetical protein